MTQYKKRRNGETMFDLQWKNMYVELKDYKKRFGNCDVPQNWIENHALGMWVIRQRTYKYRLTDERIAWLDEINFTWNIFDALWEKTYQELVAYKEIFGHCNVSKGQPEYYELADWLAKQRKDRKNEEPRLTQSKIEKLDAIGIEWNVYVKPGWDNFFEELVKFKSAYGHCRVKKTIEGYDALSNWVVLQRRIVDLTEEQRTRLDEIGFIWSIKPRLVKTSAGRRRQTSIATTT